MNDIREHYQSLWIKHGESASTLQYRDRASQFARFDILCDLTYEPDSIMDVGCGLGDLLVHQRNNGFKGRYLGLDFVDEFIGHATEKFADDALAAFKQFDAWSGAMPDEYEHITLSGAFNNKFDRNKEFLWHCISTMYSACERSVSFNALSTYVDYQDAHLFYVNPIKVFDFCKRNCSKRVAMRHDYVLNASGFPYEFTIHIYK